MSNCNPIGLRSRTTNGAVEGDRLGSGRVVARLDRKRLGQNTFTTNWDSIRGVFDEQTRRKPLVFAAEAVRYGI